MRRLPAGAGDGSAIGTFVLVDGAPELRDDARMELPTLPTQTAVVAVPASGPGALAGFQSVCSCGLTIRSSLETLARQDVAEHARWHEKRGR